MKLDELPTGTDVIVEVKFGESRIEFHSKVLGCDGVGIYIVPYIFKDTVINFADLHYSDLTYNIHFVDEYGARNAWNNVSIEIKKFKGTERYLVHAKGYLKFSQSSERRVNNRLQLGVGGFLQLKDGKRYQAKIHDISDTGIAFFSDKDAFTVADMMDVSFFDVAREQEFNIHLRVRIVRVEERKEGTLYAARIIMTDKELLGYMCFKRMEKKAFDNAIKNAYA